MDLELKNKVFIITGGAKGIGKGIACAIANEGGISVLAGRSKEVGKGVVDELKKQGNEAFFIPAELSDKENCRRIVESTLEKYGQINGLINNAGVNDGVGLEAGNPERFVKSIGSNLNHYYFMAHYCLDQLKETKGTILNISSKTALTGQGNTSGYAAAKGAQLALTREWAVELLKYNIRVNAIIPAEVDTPQYSNWISTFDNPQEKLASITTKIPFENRMTTIEEIASTAIFLISSRASHITGQHIFVDGGYVHLDRSLS